MSKSIASATLGVAIAMAAAVASSGAAQAGDGERRELGAHVHGEGALRIAVEGDAVVMELDAPGFDIVGFEHEATSDEDRAQIAAAIETLSNPGALFVVNGAAGCATTSVNVTLLSDDDEDHDHDGHAEHEDHDHAEHKDHDHDDHAEHQDHDHGDHAEHKDHDHGDHGDHDGHDHGEHAEARHTEFRSVYSVTCADPGAARSIDFAYFEAFPNAQALDVQIVTDAGAYVFEVTRAAPTLALDGVR